MRENHAPVKTGKLVKRLPSTVVRAGVNGGWTYLTDEEQSRLMAVRQQHSAAIALRRSGLTPDEIDGLDGLSAEIEKIWTSRRRVC